MRKSDVRKSVKNKKGSLDISFGWVFAVLVGAFILFLAIYGVIKFVNLQKNSISSESARSIGVLTDPLETSFETGKRGMITTGAETRIFTNCSNISIFGKQILRTSEKSYDRWGEGSVDATFQNKYIFSKDPVEGKKFYVFSKPMDFPFKVADLIYLTSTLDKYCFINPPGDIRQEISDLQGQDISKDENLFVVTRKSECAAGSITVCFSGETTCDVLVNRNWNRVQHRGQRPVYFQGDALMYAAIFSSPADYECQLDRLMNRTEQLFEVYYDKSNFVLNKTGCNSDLDVQFVQMLTFIKGFQDSSDLATIYSLADEMNTINEYAECKLW